MSFISYGNKEFSGYSSNYPTYKFREQFNTGLLFFKTFRVSRILRIIGKYLHIFDCWHMINCTEFTRCYLHETFALRLYSNAKCIQHDYTEPEYCSWVGGLVRE